MCKQKALSRPLVAAVQLSPPGCRPTLATAPQVAQLFMRIDADCGGTIDWEEFVDYFFLQVGGWVRGSAGFGPMFALLRCRTLTCCAFTSCCSAPPVGAATAALTGACIPRQAAGGVGEAALLCQEQAAHAFPLRFHPAAATAAANSATHPSHPSPSRAPSPHRTTGARSGVARGTRSRRSACTAAPPHWTATLQPGAAASSGGCLPA